MLSALVALFVLLQCRINGVGIVIDILWRLTLVLEAEQRLTAHSLSISWITRIIALGLEPGNEKNEIGISRFCIMIAFGSLRNK